MTTDQLKNKIGFQIGLMQFSGKTEEKTIEDITQLAIDYSNEAVSDLLEALKKSNLELSEFYQELPLEGLKRIIKDNELLINRLTS